jgi:hypothetical protein
MIGGGDMQREKAEFGLTMYFFLASTAASL